MKLVQWQFHNIQMPMLEDEEGNLYCTTKSLCEALQVSEPSLKMLQHRHSDEFSALTVTNCDAKEFIGRNREVFGIQRVRDDMRLWTEDDMLIFAILSKSGVSKEFRGHLIQFIKENARRGYVTRKEHDELKGRLDDLQEHIDYIMPSLRASASAAGIGLAAHRKTKELRS